MTSSTPQPENAPPAASVADGPDAEALHVAAPAADAPDVDGPDAETLDLARSLFDACRAGNADGVLPYVDAGAPASLRDAEGNSLLMLAAYHGQAQLVTELARRGADVDALNDRGQSPLAGAAFKGFTEVADALLAAGADPDLGTPSARDTAAYFQRADISAAIEAAAPRA